MGWQVCRANTAGRGACLKFVPTGLSGVVLVEMQCQEDERGFFARTFCRNEFDAQGLDPSVAQCNLSFNRRRGIVRGMHFQAAPHEEAKLVRCVRGAIYDVVVDLRGSSSTFLQWRGFDLTAQNRHALYVPKGFAHGFQTIEDDTEVLYQMSTVYVPAASRGVRWNDPAFEIRWPISDIVTSDRDRSYPDFKRPAT